MYELFVFGSIGFWLLVTIEVILLFVANSKSNGILAFISLFVFGAALQFFGKVDIISYISTHRYFAGSMLIAYYALGGLWAIKKWRRFVYDENEKLTEFFRKFLIRKGLPPTTKILPMDYRQDWVSECKKTKNYDTGLTIADTPQATGHKVTIIRWMSLWIFGFIAWIAHDFILDIFQWMYMCMVGILQKMADKIWAKGLDRENFNVPTVSEE